MEIFVSIIDDHPLVISGIRTVLQDVAHIHIIGGYDNAEDLLHALEKVQPDVLLLDIQMPDITGDELAKQILKKYPDIRILAITGFNNTFYVEKLLAAGAYGYLMKNTDRQTLVQAIETVYVGDRFLDPVVKARLSDQPSVQKDSMYQKISEREKEVLQLIAQEYTSEQIAQKLFISQRTVDNHRFHLLQKLNVKNTVGLVKAAMEMGLIG